MISIETILNLKDKISPNTCIIVEGKRDKLALEKLKFKNVIPISGKSDLSLIETLKNKEVKRVVLLTDFDREGEKRHQTLYRLLQKNGIKVDVIVRDKFKAAFNIRKIEEMSSIAETIDDYYRGNSHLTVGKATNISKFLKRKKYKKVRYQVNNH